MGQNVALLRGINVGGKNLIKMTALKACLDEHGFRSVVTYIQPEFAGALGGDDVVLAVEGAAHTGVVTGRPSRRRVPIPSARPAADPPPST